MKISETKHIAKTKHGDVVKRNPKRHEVKPIPKSKLPKGWRPERGEFALNGYSYVKEMPKTFYKGDSNYRLFVEDWSDKTSKFKIRVILFRKIPAQYSGGSLKRLRDMEVIHPEAANRIALRIMDDVNGGKYDHVKYDDLSKKEKEFVKFSDTYSIEGGYVYDPEQQEYPDIGQIQDEITWREKGEI